MSSVENDPRLLADHLHPPRHREPTQRTRRHRLPVPPGQPSHKRRHRNRPIDYRKVGATNPPSLVFRDGGGRQNATTLVLPPKNRANCRLQTLHTATRTPPLRRHLTDNLMSPVI